MTDVEFFTRRGATVLPPGDPRVRAALRTLAAEGRVVTRGTFRAAAAKPAGQDLRTRLMVAARLSYDECEGLSTLEVAHRAAARGVEVSDDDWIALGDRDRGLPSGWRVARQKAVDPFRSWGL